jgi:hypothetical protein
MTQQKNGPLLINKKNDASSGSMANQLNFTYDFASLCYRMDTTVLFILNVPDSNPGPKTGVSDPDIAVAFLSHSK